MNRFFAYLCYVFSAITTIFIVIFEGFSGIFSFISILLFSVFFAAILRLLSEKYTKNSWKKAIFSALLSIMTTIGVFISIFGIFIGYHNFLNPAVLPNVFLENNKWQKIVFVKMSHIARPEFFQQKNASLQKLAQGGFEIMAEGVGTGSIDATKSLNEHMGVDDFAQLYSEISKVTGLDHQDHRLYSGIDKEKIVSVDISLDEVAKNFASENIQKPERTIRINDIRAVREKMSAPQLWLTNQVARMVMNIIAKTEWLEDLFNDSSTKKMMSVILHRRNEPIVEYIQKNSQKNIAIVYGALHFDGILSRLRQYDPSWKITSLEVFTPYSQ